MGLRSSFIIAYCDLGIFPTIWPVLRTIDAQSSGTDLYVFLHVFFYNKNVVLPEPHFYQLFPKLSLRFS